MKEQENFFTTKRIVWLVIGFLAFLFCVSGCTSFNGMDNADESVDESWGKVQTQYQRRMDLIPNLVETVKGYVGHENQTLKDVIEARSKASSITIDPTNITQEQLDKLTEVQDGLAGTLSKLMMLTENYPDLKADKQFTMLQAEIAGTENRISFARDNFNKDVKTYNKKLRGVTGRFWSSLFGFEKRAYFEAQQGADIAPNVKF